ncbi:MAG: hypothetical protein HKM04_11825 [Legionellales bacterium]|nr:hypothetical protein [Legionellales bacterium]
MIVQILTTLDLQILIPYAEITLRGLTTAPVVSMPLLELKINLQQFISEHGDPQSALCLFGEALNKQVIDICNPFFYEQVWRKKVLAANLKITIDATYQSNQPLASHSLPMNN